MGGGSFRRLRCTQTCSQCLGSGQASFLGGLADTNDLERGFDHGGVLDTGTRDVD